MKGSSNQQDSGETSRLKKKPLLKYQWLLWFEVAALCVLLAMVWGLLALPVIFYFHTLPLPDDNGSTELDENVSMAASYDEMFPDCRDNFFRDEQYNNACVPVCPSWTRDPPYINVIIDVTVFLSYSTGFITAIIIVVISGIRYKTMNCAGIYGTLSVALWWFMLVAALFWKVWFPFHANACKAKNQLTYIHISCAFAGLLIPVLPIVLHMANFAHKAKSDPAIDFVSGGLGFNLIRFPPLPCHGNSRAFVFYATILPNDLIIAVGITLILLVFWLVHRVAQKFQREKESSVAVWKATEVYLDQPPAESSRRD